MTVNVLLVFVLACIACCVFPSNCVYCDAVHVRCSQGGGGVLGISSDGDERRIFLGLKFSIPGFFWVRKLGKYFFG